MTRWPEDFAALLSPAGRRLLEEGEAAPQFAAGSSATPYLNLRDVLDADRSRECLAALEAGWPLMRRHRVDYPIRPETQAAPELDYVSAPFLARHYQMLCPLHGHRAGLDEAGRRESEQFFDHSGLRRFAASPALQRLAERLTGYRLRRSPQSGILVVCYGAFDYLGPHTDVSWPFVAGWDNAARPIAYLDLHLVFTTDAVAQQLLVIQNGAHLDRVVGGEPVNGALSLYRLPFWHYSTPLLPKPGREAEARRWIVMLNFAIEGDDRPKLLGP